MKGDNDFYIGWKDDMSEDNSKFLKKVLALLFLFIPMLIFTVVFFQKPFNNHQFEFGKTTAIIGTYYDNPVPMLIADKGVLADSLSHDIILVGYGKFGAKGIISNIEQVHGKLNGKKIKLSGTLIYGDGKTLMELTKKEASLNEVLNAPMVSPTDIQFTTDVFLSGEIVDPKCYFGVMKPGEGKVHKSCAIRCISGGIPPILKTRSTQNQNQYYILLDESGNAVNEFVLPFVGEQITISGRASQFSNWDVLYVNKNDLRLSEE